jgi:TonB family protein
MKSLLALLVLLPAAAWGQTAPSGQAFGSTCAYPDEARAAHREGTTLLSYTGTADGRLGDVRVVHSSGYPDLDDAAVRCMFQWRFDPVRDKVSIGDHRWSIAWALDASGAVAGKSIGVPHDCLPYYPDEEAKAGIEGTTTVHFTITEKGRAADPSLARSSGNEHLDRAALQCVKHWRYRPAIANGMPVSVPWTADVVWKSIVPPIPAFAEPQRDCLKSYPVKAADLAGIAGVTELELVIVRGDVKTVSILHSSGNKAMDEAASACVATRHYVREMVMVDGKDVDRFRTITLRERIVWADALKTTK